MALFQRLVSQIILNRNGKYIEKFRLVKNLIYFSLFFLIVYATQEWHRMLAEADTRSVVGHY